METVLVFKAGKMLMEGVQVRADPRKGLFCIARDEAGLVHVQWQDRVSGAVEDDQIVFADEAIFEKVQQSNGRVYILKFKTDDRKMFFWLQEPNPAGDERLCDAVNIQINQPVVEEASVEESIERDIVNTADDTGKATPSGGGAVENIRNPPVQLAELQQILANLGQSLNGHGGTSRAFQDPGPSLTDVLKPDHVLPLLENSHQWEERLSQYLPEGKWTPEAIADLMQSPQFRQQLDMFTHALRSGQMDLQQFGIDPSQCDFTVASFLEAIQNQVEAGDHSQRDVDDMDE
ncbi:26S proteasome regulatory subunit RPN13 isoform X1 [Selaginella moellendorffii]|uniref:26S proteasome regulatory subunit RPN13 isoform X1 n=1 Tax=Selaginella moellendorffii TaxID=88036 RepID=UPI000D1C7581|nr:26S proteasome regulatory subunit RPN13 isoform X1 [Selaginella moellendorffii]|eukprot:XP_024514845.1 26S proteasome regulatory subunit RPN13 isoform X1 [Selaginella moellendorffii]